MIENDLRVRAQIIYFENSFGEFTLGVYFETELWDGAMMRSSSSIFDIERSLLEFSLIAF